MTKHNENIIFWYLSYFLLVFIVGFFILIYFRDDNLLYLVQKYKNDIQRKYDKYLYELDSKVDFIYSNEIIRNKDLIKIFKEFSSKEDLKKTLYDKLEPSFSYYRTLGLYDMSFYTATEEFIVNFEDSFLEDDTFSPKIVKKAAYNKKDFFDYKLIPGKTLFVYSKPIFDEDLNLIGIMNLEFDFKNILNKINDDSELKFDMFISNYFEYYRKGYNIFLPVFKSNLDDITIYLEAKDLVEDEKFIAIKNLYNRILVLFIVFLVLFFYLVYLIKILKLKRKLIKNAYNELFSQMDNYVSRLDTDLEGNIIYVTKSFCKETGYSKKELIGKNANLLRHPDVVKGFYKSFWEDLNTKKLWQGELKNKDKYGNAYWVYATLFPLYNMKKKHIGYSSIRVDVTALKQLEKTNKLLKEDLSKKLNDIRIKDSKVLNLTKIALMSKILDSFSHQWQKPISKISFELQNIENTDLEKLKHSIEIQLQDLSNMLNDMKTLFTTRDNKSANLYEIVKNIKETLRYKTIKIQYEIDENIKLDIASNELRKIISSIISNIKEQSLMYALEQVVVKISSEMDSNTSEIILKIEDNIKDERKKAYFEDILKFDGEKYFDTSIYLAKLLSDKNELIFWCKYFDDKTFYYLKLKKSKK